MRSILLAVFPALLLSACSTIPGCPRNFCNYKDDLTVYGRNVRLLYEDNFKEIGGSCQFRTELTTGGYVPSTNQEAITVLRNMAGEIGANALVFQSFRRDKDAVGRAYVCPAFGTPTTSSNTNTQQQTQTQVQQPQQVVSNTMNTVQNSRETQQPASNQNTQSTFPQSSTAASVNDTGRRLSWQTCSMGQSFQANRCTGQATTETLQTAASYCASQGSAGYVYRLPDRLELASLLKEGNAGAKVDPQIFPDTKPDIYWTRESYNGSPITNWVVDFGGGGSFGYGAENQAYVRCVANLP